MILLTIHEGRDVIESRLFTRRYVMSIDEKAIQRVSKEKENLDNTWGKHLVKSAAILMTLLEGYLESGEIVKKSMASDLVTLKEIGGLHKLNGFLKGLRDILNSGSDIVLRLMYGPLMSTKEVAAEIGISIRSLYDLRKSGGITAIYLSEGRIAFDSAEVGKYIDKIRREAGVI